MDKSIEKDQGKKSPYEQVTENKNKLLCLLIKEKSYNKT